MKDVAHWALDTCAYLNEAISVVFTQLAEIVSLAIQIFFRILHLLLLTSFYAILILIDLYEYNLRVLIVRIIRQLTS